MQKQKMGVLFVCLGNICRSPMAEAVFRNQVEQRGLSAFYQIDSAGTGDWHLGNRPHRGTLETLQSHGVSSAGMFARQVCADDFEQFDYIVCMDASNARNVRGFARGAHQATIKRLLEWVPEQASQDADVPDPYYDGRFEYVYQLVNTGCERLLDDLETKRQQKN
jgi:protein-tyrosine phosphatase